MTARSSDDRRHRRLLLSLFSIFFLSGALGLVYEILWLRKLLLVFGSTVHAVSTVLTVFFGGLALGSWWVGRLIDRRPSWALRWYAACEVAVGLYALATPWLFALVERCYIPLYRASDFSPMVLVAAAFACSVVVLILPTLLMGATLPLLSRYLITTMPGRGAGVALLYGINTLGAMTGVLGVYWVALPTLGWLATLQCAGLVNLVLGIMAHGLDRQFRIAGPEAVAAVDEPPPASSGSVPGLLAAFALSGFSAMVYEVAWTRTLSLVLGSSIYAFCLMLAAFLGGIALGSLLMRGYLRAHQPAVPLVVWLEVLLALYGLGSIALFGMLPDWVVRLWPVFNRSFAGWVALQAVMSLMVMALPTIIMGMLFPVVSELAARQLADLGAQVGRVYAVNTIGGILGSFLSGFWMIPVMGIAWTLVIAALVNLSAALVIYINGSDGTLGRRIGLAATALLLWVGLGQWVFVPSWQAAAFAEGVFMNPNRFGQMPVAQQAARQNTLLFYRESLNTTVSVHRSKENPALLYLKVGGKTDASTGVDMGTQVLAAHLPMLVHGPAQRALVIGLGSGVTVGSLGRYPVPVIHCVELDPAVVEGARFFAEANYRIHQDPRVRFFIGDGRNFLLASQDQYDVIISEPSNPWMAGVATLFTDEFYQAAKRRLAPGGVMAQWVQLYSMFPVDVKVLLRTFQANFPSVSVWSTTPGDLVLVGSLEPQHLDERRLQQRAASTAVQEDLARIGITDPRVVLEWRWLETPQITQLTLDVPWTHQDDDLWLEFSAPKALHQDTFGINEEGLRQWKPSVPDPQDAGFHLALGRAYQARDEHAHAVTALERATTLDPTQSPAWLELAKAHAKQGSPLKALDAVANAIERDPDMQEAHHAQARILWQQGKREEALQGYERLAMLKTPDAALAKELAEVLHEVGRSQEAAEYFRSALSQTTEAHPRLLTALASACKASGQMDDAAQVLEIGRRRHPHDTDLLILSADVARLLGRQDQAQQWFEQVIERSPRSAKAYFGLGELALQAGRPAQAIRWTKSGLRHDPYNPRALKLLQMLQSSPS